MILFPLAIIELDDESDKAFMKNVFEDFQKIMYLKAYSVMKNTHDAEDIVNECWIALCDHIPLLRELKQKSFCDLRRYLVIAVRNACINRMNKKDRRHEVLFEGSDEYAASVQAKHSAEDEAVMAVSIEECMKAVKMLPEMYYDILMMKSVQGASNAEIAKQFGIKEDSVRAYVSSARKKARAMLIKMRGEKYE